jgi:hypothetical protein
MGAPGLAIFETRESATVPYCSATKYCSIFPSGIW